MNRINLTENNFNLQKSGFVVVFKELVYNNSGRSKGNCDADLVLKAVCDVYERKMDRVLIVTSDSDYAGLIKFLQKKERLLGILSPRNKDKCSILLKRTGAKIGYINDQRSNLQSIKKSP